MLIFKVLTLPLVNSAGKSVSILHGLHGPETDHADHLFMLSVLTLF